MIGIDVCTPWYTEGLPGWLCVLEQKQTKGLPWSVCWWEQTGVLVWANEQLAVVGVLVGSNEGLAVVGVLVGANRGLPWVVVCVGAKANKRLTLTHPNIQIPQNWCFWCSIWQEGSNAKIRMEKVQELTCGRWKRWKKCPFCLMPIL